MAAAPAPESVAAPRTVPLARLEAIKDLFRDYGGTVLLLQADKEPDRTFVIAKSPADVARWVGRLPAGTRRRKRQRSRSAEQRPRSSTDEAGREPPVRDEAADEDAPVYRRRQEEEDARQVRGRRPGSEPRRVGHAQEQPPVVYSMGPSSIRRTERKRRDRLLKEVTTALYNSDEDNSDAEARYAREHASKFQFLGKQRACQGMGYRQAADLVHKATAVGGLDSLENWKMFLRQWRSYGCLRGTNLGPLGALSASQAEIVNTQRELQVGSQTKADEPLHRLQHMLEIVSRTEAIGVVQDVLYRYNLAQLYSCYEDAEGWLQESLRSSRGSRARGIGDKSIVKRTLFDLLYAGTGLSRSQLSASRSVSIVDASAVEGRLRSASGEGGSEARLWRQFSKRLEKGQRWHTVCERLGLGILPLLPSSIISHTWLERLPWGRFTAWLDLIRDHNRPAIQYGQLIEDSAEDACYGRKPPMHRVPLEDLDDEEIRAVSGKDREALLT